jgi:secreted protein with Ig-like and vWFA domain
MACENRIDKVKEALIFFTDVLNENDHVSLVVFNHESKVVFPAQKIEKKIRLLKEDISYIEADGFTNIISGLELGCKEVEKNFKKKNTNRVVLLTDGYGSDDPLKCIAKAKEYHKKGIDCSVVGVGNDYNFGLLREIAALGGGLTEFLDDKDNFKNIFAKELGASVFPIAENIKTEVYFNKNLLFAQLLGAPVEEKRDGKVVLRLRKAYSGLDQLALIKFSLVNPSKAIENEPVIIKTKYYDLQQDKNVEIETKAFLQWSPDDGKLEFLIEAETKYNYSVALLNQTMKVMAEEFLKGDKKGARNAIVNAMKEVKEIFPNVTDEEIQDLLKKLEFYEDILNKQI